MMSMVAILLGLKFWNVAISLELRCCIMMISVLPVIFSATF